MVKPDIAVFLSTYAKHIAGGLGDPTTKHWSSPPRESWGSFQS